MQKHLLIALVLVSGCLMAVSAAPATSRGLQTADDDDDSSGIRSNSASDDPSASDDSASSDAPGAPACAAEDEACSSIEGTVFGQAAVDAGCCADSCVHLDPGNINAVLCADTQPFVDGTQNGLADMNCVCFLN